MDPEVINQAAGPVHRLGAHSCTTTDHITDLKGRHIDLGAIDEHPDACRARHLRDAHAPMLFGDPPEAWVAEDVAQVCEGDVATAVTLAGRRENGIGSDVDTAVHRRVEIHPQEGVAGVGTG